MQGHSAMDIRKIINIHKRISMIYGYQSSIIHAFMNIHLDILGFLWVSMHWLGLARFFHSNDDNMNRDQQEFFNRSSIGNQNMPVSKNCIYDKIYVRRPIRCDWGWVAWVSARHFQYSTSNLEHSFLFPVVPIFRGPFWRCRDTARRGGGRLSQRPLTATTRAPVFVSATPSAGRPKPKVSNYTAQCTHSYHVSRKP